jgi:hypothetical protein
VIEELLELEEATLEEATDELATLDEATLEEATDELATLLDEAVAACP